MEAIDEAGGKGVRLVGESTDIWGGQQESGGGVPSSGTCICGGRDQDKRLGRNRL